jgi:hypothetical protein
MRHFSQCLLIFFSVSSQNLLKNLGRERDKRQYVEKKDTSISYLDALYGQ